jgi:membrane protease YdiL (CAAX protease family)
MTHEGEAMQTARPANNKNEGNGPIVAWVVLLFFLIFLCLLPFIAGGVTISGLGKLRPSSPLFALCIAGFTFVGYTPTLSAILVARLFPRDSAVRSVLRQVKTWRAGIGWYVIAVFGPTVLFLLDEIINLLLGGSPPQKWIVLPSLSGFFPGSLFFNIMGLLAGTLGEEFGWRGFAQPRLQSRYGALKASIFIGLVWGTFHLWILPICPHCLSLTEVVVTQYLRLMATAIIYAWMYNSTKGSLFLVMVAHAAHNLTVDLMPQVGGSSVIVALSYVAVAIIVVFLTDQRTLTRPKQEQPESLG